MILCQGRQNDHGKAEATARKEHALNNSRFPRAGTRRSNTINWHGIFIYIKDDNSNWARSQHISYFTWILPTWVRTPGTWPLMLTPKLMNRKKKVNWTDQGRSRRKTTTGASENPDRLDSSQHRKPQPTKPILSRQEHTTSTTKWREN